MRLRGRQVVSVIGVRGRPGEAEPLELIVGGRAGLSPLTDLVDPIVQAPILIHAGARNCARSGGPTTCDW